jgi:CHAD domain-containing protein
LEIELRPGGTREDLSSAVAALHSVEFFRPILGESVASLAKGCVAYQDCLGLYQDARVALPMLGGLAYEPAIRESSGGLR